MTNFQRGNGQGTGTGTGTPPTPIRPAKTAPLLPPHDAGTHPHIFIHTDHPIDFINPDYHLLEKIFGYIPSVDVVA